MQIATRPNEIWSTRQQPRCAAPSSGVPFLHCVVSAIKPFRPAVFRFQGRDLTLRQRAAGIRVKSDVRSAFSVTATAAAFYYSPCIAGFGCFGACGRVGWPASPAFLLYANGGLAYGEVRQTSIPTQTIAPPDPSFALPGFGSNTTTRAGYTIGGGGEWMFSPRWSLKFEALYYDLGNVSYSLMTSSVVAIAAPVNGRRRGGYRHNFEAARPASRDNVADLCAPV